MRNVRTMMAWVAVGLVTGCVGVGCGDSSSSDDPGGTAGAENGGAGGQDGGAGGKAGKGGSGGQAGKGGSAGASGTGGSAGKGGSAGAGGTGGAAGSAGKGGAAGAGGAATFCTPAATEPCYSGPSETEGVGLCTAGERACLPDGSAWGECDGEILPATETCLTPGDDDCDGQTNEDGEGCTCVPGTAEACYSGPPSTKNVGVCKGGTQTCNATGTGYGECEGEVTPGTETCAALEDEDCDGTANEEGEECVCVPGAEAECYSGPSGTQGVGVCTAGKKLCAADGKSYGECTGEVLPGTETCNTEGDDDCDGQANEDGSGCACAPGATQECYSGPATTKDVGTCKAGSQTCNANGTGWGNCEGEVTPVDETCVTPQDEDCDGQTNESGETCVCIPLAVVACYTGPSGTQNVGACKSGTKTCNETGTAYGDCTGEVLPVEETCSTADDDDCDGQVNESGTGCLCLPGATQACYSGASGTENVGPCKGGTQTCNPLGTGYGSCVGEVLPVSETCDTSIDDDCDGQVNESGVGCVCLPNSTASCYSGPAGTQGVGICVNGTKTCNAEGTAYGACSGEVLPAAETCNTPADDDCDGQTNEDGSGCVCQPNSNVACYSGPAGTQGVGACAGGTQTCNAQGTAYGACTGEVLPAAESCNTPVDDDCDGQTNESGLGCVCAPNSTASCYTGPAGTQGVGICAAGTQTCNALGTAYGACAGEVLPAAETCNTAMDDDCDGQTNESGAGCVCLPNSTQACYTGPAGTQGVGTCKAGTETCNAQGTSYGACAGEVVPGAEVCTNSLDEDCTGTANNGCIYSSCKEILQYNPGSLSGLYTIDTDGAGGKAPFSVYCDMTTDGGGYTMVRFDSATLGVDQNAYATMCANYGLEVVVPRTKAHAQSLYTWNGNVVPNLYNVFPKYNGAQGIFNWQGICKGAPCTFWMTDTGNGDVGCTNFEPNGDNNTAFRIYKRAEGCGIQGNWNDANNGIGVPGWVVCSTNDK